MHVGDRYPDLEEEKPDDGSVERRLMTEARRAALDALEREFEQLLKSRER